MKITILLNQPYPYGMALTNRIHLYAKRFHDRGHDVEIVIPKQTESHRTAPRNFQKTGEYEGVSFVYPLSPLRSESFITRRFNDVLTFFMSLNYILKTKRDSDVFLLVGSGLHLILSYKIFCSIFKIKYIFERSEFPFVFTHRKDIVTRLYQKIYVKYIFRLFDGIIVISQSLLDYFRERVSDKTKLIIVPILTNISVFEPTKNNSGEIVYAGTLNQAKDGIMDLLQAYLLFSKKMAGKKLVLMGDINMADEKSRIEAFIKENNLSENIEVTGYVSRPEMIKRMTNAAVLVLAKPSSVQADHCFPTKLAEYLSTGKPVLTTDTGSISQYLTNGKDSFLIEPDDPAVLADSFYNIFSNYDAAEIIGGNGRKVAQDQFEYTTQGDRIISFFKEILNNYKS
jgi:glycosyltransferase involved in cell wall biosynthesis